MDREGLVAVRELLAGTVTLLFYNVDHSTELVKRLGERGRNGAPSIQGPIAGDAASAHARRLQNR
jgi:hypothetical protein